MIDLLHKFISDTSMHIIRTLILLSILTLVGCVSTPEPNPISVKQEGDTDLSCEYLRAEYISNTEAATRKISKNKNGDVKDAAVGLLIWPGLADFNNAPGHEGNALLDRNSWLKSLAEVESCDTSNWPKQPSRY
jgi:hypothetical protein